MDFVNSAGANSALRWKRIWKRELGEIGIFHNISSAFGVTTRFAMRRRVLGSMFMLAAVTLAPGFALCQALAIPSETTRCEGLVAFADDPDPAGLNVRGGPSTDAPIVGVLKLHSFARDAVGRELLQAPRFAILGSYRGWLLVDGFAWPDPPDDPLPKGPGWVHGSRVSVRSYGDGSSRIYPTKAAATGAPVDGLRFSILSCNGSWLEVRERVFSATAKPIAGWLKAPDACAGQAERAQVVNPCSRR
ncbi:hypothetical protein ABLE93_07395 [Xanthobacter sp. KR7-65]|uniref:hypothetical protein n=1 Tax=Xanthobacter sp. KR7-65 TaxID=3156612 RepID=UPI0032B44F96